MEDKHQIITLDVGGTIFKTYEDTLLKLPYFQAYKNMEKTIPDQLFFDREPKAFRHILGLLRDPPYNFPKKYYGELDFWGLDPGQIVPGFSLEDFNQKAEGETDIDKPHERRGWTCYHKYFGHVYSSDGHDKEVTMFIKNYYSSDGLDCNFTPFKKFFKGYQWSYTLTSDGAYSGLALLLPRLEDLSKFRVTLQFEGSRTQPDNLQIPPRDISYNLEVSPYILSCTREIKGFRYIPLYLLFTQNDNFVKPNGLSLTISLSTEHHYSSDTEKLSALCWLFSPISRYLMNQMKDNPRDQIESQIREIPITQGEAILEWGYIQYLIFKTNPEYTKIKIINKHTQKETVYDTIDCRLLYRDKIYPGEILPKGWGFVCLCLNPKKFDMDTGGLINNDEFIVKFEPEVEGTLWQVSSIVTRYCPTFLYSLRCCSTEIKPKIVEKLSRLSIHNIN